MPRRKIRCNQIQTGPDGSKDISLELTVPGAVGFGNGILTSGLEFREEQEFGEEGEPGGIRQVSAIWASASLAFGFVIDKSLEAVEGVIETEDDDDAQYIAVLDRINYTDTIGRVDWQVLEFTGASEDEPDLEHDGAGMAIVYTFDSDTAGGLFTFEAFLDSVSVGILGLNLSGSPP